MANKSAAASAPQGARPRQAGRAALCHPRRVPPSRPPRRFAGVRVVARDGKPVVHLLPEQAKFYLDQGAIAPLSS
jgi:hypothetical protein